MGPRTVSVTVEVVLTNGRIVKVEETIAIRKLSPCWTVAHHDHDPGRLGVYLADHAPGTRNGAWHHEHCCREQDGPTAAAGTAAGVIEQSVSGLPLHA